MAKIKATDLMIGNLMQDQDGNILQVIEITEKNIVYKVVDRTKFPLKDGWKAYPFPLTEEILLKCGFKLSLNKCCYGMITDTAKSRLSIFPDGTFKIGTEDLESKIKYLHQLQNLFKSLTGNDLKIEV